MRAGIQESLRLAVAIPHEDELPAGNLAAQEVTRFGNLGLMTDHLPGDVEDLGLLLGENACVIIGRAMNLEVTLLRVDSEEAGLIGAVPDHGSLSLGR